MANQLPEEVIEEVRKANDIVDVIGEYVQLKKQGRNFFGLCPFHGENTPSFSVTQEKQIFHCFGCQKGGNVITFMMEIEGFSFYEALKFLADKSGTDLPESASSPQNSLTQENQRLLSAYEWLTKFYHHLLRHTKDGKEGYQYFRDRGLDEETIEAFQLGFAPNAKDFTKEFLDKKGFHQQLLIKAGLLSLQDDNSVSDRFRGRVIFPIRNHLGKTIGFGGRAIAGQEPKYLNSSESELFQKGKLLYNFDLAKKHIRKRSEVVLFEGYMDVIASYQAGVKNGVATMGTALTEMQAKLLRRYADRVIICYDGDSAGTEATVKAAELLRRTGSEVRVAVLEDDMDPDNFIQAYGAEAFQTQVIQASDAFIGFYIRHLKKDYNLSLEGERIKYIEAVLDQLAMIESPVEREYYLKELSNQYNITMETLTEEISSRRRKSGFHQHKSDRNRYTREYAGKPKTNKLLPAFQNAEKKLISYMLQDPYISDKVREELGAGFNMDEHQIIATRLYAHYEEGNSADVSLFIENLSDPHLRELVAEMAMTPLFEGISDKEVNDYIRIIRTQASASGSVRELKEQQRLAEQQQDPVKAAQIAMQIIELQKQLKNIN
ncbi:DNA primase [Lentibacillus sediminis]|uniref:DNA primase n=1 Tax=Lentibacillus sediminis TaxID=1940529 RepID=UPI000C1B89FE|nr:DNA primase [Lentibacillus sediminis]